MKLIAGVAERSEETGESFSELLASLCSFRTFSFPGDDQDFDNVAHCNILLDLYLHAKDYEAETGRSVVLPALQSVYKSVPEVWTINLSDKKASLFLEMLKLQNVKKAVELTGWSNEKRKARSFFQCLPHISQLRFDPHLLVLVHFFKKKRTDLVNKLQSKVLYTVSTVFLIAVLFLEWLKMLSFLCHFAILQAV